MQPVKPISEEGFRNQHLVLSADDRDGIVHVGPVDCSEGGVLLELKTASVRRPDDDEIVGRGPFEPKNGRTRHLNQGVHRPEAAIQSELAAAHPARIRLADGSTDRKTPAAARAAAAIDRKPINGKILPAQLKSAEQQAKRQSEKLKFFHALLLDIQLDAEPLADLFQEVVLLVLPPNSRHLLCSN